MCDHWWNNAAWWVLIGAVAFGALLTLAVELIVQDLS